MKPVVIETPYAAKDDEQLRLNLLYLRACLRHSLLLGEAPFASHAIYTQPGVLCDELSEERLHGIEAGFAVRSLFSATVFYIDLGMSTGMRLGMEVALRLPSHKILTRKLADNWQDTAKSNTKKFLKRHLWGVE